MSVLRGNTQRTKSGGVLCLAALCACTIDPGSAEEGQLPQHTHDVSDITGIDLAGELETLQAELAALRGELEASDECPRIVLSDGTRRVYAVDRSTAGVTRCSFGADEMVAVAGFWIDRYEASAWDSAACTGYQYGVTTGNYPATFPDNGNWSAPLYACSKAGVVPSRVLTWFQAQQACALSGKRLCTNDEWQAAAAGTSDPGAYDGSTTAPCHTAGTGPRATGTGSGAPGGASACVSVWGAEDMVGNVGEWVALWEMEPGWNGTMSSWPTSSPDDYGGDGYWHGGPEPDAAWEAAGSHQVWDGAQGARLPAAAHRGGAWAGGTAAGVFTVALNRGPSDSKEGIGFRCCRSR